MNNPISSLPAFVRGSDLDTSVFYMGSLMSFLAKGTDTGGRFAVVEYQARPGNEPPPHVHHWENELFYVLEGVMELYVGSKVLVVGPGNLAFAPQDKPHAFTIRSPLLRMLVLVQATGAHAVGLDAYFNAMATPAEQMDLPANAVTYRMDDPAHAVQVAAEHGLRILTPEETARELPSYPGFGVACDMIATNERPAVRAA
jgi:quercetin dioxygenase-like cupin family protein